MASNVVAFPPPKPPALPPIPEPPRFPPDPRQQRFVAIVGGLNRQLSGAAHIVNSNVSTGFPASAPDIGKLQSVLASSIERMDMRAVRKRWKGEVSPWFEHVVLTWVQRCKEMRSVVRRNGVHVRLRSQDDHGYYFFAFDVFPGIPTPEKPKGIRAV